MPKPFLDTNVLLYAFTDSDWRKERAVDILAGGGVVSVQVLNEFVDVSRRKLKQEWESIRVALARLSVLIDEPVPVTLGTHRDAIDIAARYGFRTYDSLLVAAARQAGCRVLYSEDLQHGQVLDGVAIQNPFLPPDGGAP
jgi:predicted nucleic acid-binding protein